MKLQLSEIGVTLDLKVSERNLGDRLNPGDLLRVEVRQTDRLDQTFFYQFFQSLVEILYKFVVIMTIKIQTL